ncbi:MAG: DUF2817 domain-containing protein [Oligoflexia bacterium]|nr:DUF2817 domain-containing protein [Oligoflexia bacterium]
MTESILTRSRGGHDIRQYIFGSQSLPCWVLIGGVHGDEPEGAQLVLDFVSKMMEAVDQVRAQVICIPRLNPDGLENNARTNGGGVDLNRNFPTSDWSPESKAPRYNPGDNPNSEPETQAVVNLLKERKPFLVVHCHTYLPQICYTGQISLPWANHLAKNFGGHPITDDIGYPTPGSLGQFCHLELKTPVVCIELPEQVNRKKAWDLVGQSLLEISFRGL